MCQFKSMIVTKNGDVLYLYGDDSHENIIDKFKNDYDLKDDTADPKKLRFARIEIVPPNNDVFEKNLSKWILKIDQTITPKWWDKNITDKCFSGLDKYLKNVIIENQEIDLIEYKTGLFIKNSKIKVIKNSQVSMMRENSQVSEMRENSQVSEMRGNSQVSMMRGNSQVSEMWGNSQVSEMWGNSQVKLFSDKCKYKLNDNGIAIIRYTDNSIIKVANDKIKIEVENE